jgi:hypothetical protein
VIERDPSDYDKQGVAPRTKVPGRNNIAASRDDRLTNSNGRRYESATAGYTEPRYDEAPPLLPGGHDTDWQAYPSQPHPDRRRRRVISEVDDADVDNIPQPVRTNRPILAAMMFFILMAFIGSGAATGSFYFGPDFSSTDKSQVDKTAEALSHVADEQRKLTQAVSGLQQLVQNSVAKNAALREQDMQRLSAETAALKADLEGLRAAIANITVQPRITPAPKRAAVQAQKSGSEHKPATPPRTDSPPTPLVTPSPGH